MPKKIIHFCWFGSPLPAEIGDRVSRWQELHPGWEIKKWDERNIEVKDCPYAEARLKEKQWAYLSDYVRLQALWRDGGVYLDTDIEVLKPLDPFLNHSFHLGYMHDCALGTAVLISPPAHGFLKGLLECYQAFPAENALNNNSVLTEYFLTRVPCFKLDGCAWGDARVQIYPCTWFEQPALGPKGGYSVHLFSRTWGERHQARRGIPKRGNWIMFSLRRRLRVLIETIRCFYFPYYLRDKFHLPLLSLPSLQALPRLNH